MSLSTLLFSLHLSARPGGMSRPGHRREARRRLTPAPKVRQGARPRLEHLEARCVPSRLTVDHSWDNNAPANVPAPQGTLEWAAANAQNGDTIVITGAAVNHGINLTHGEVILTQQNLTIVTAANKDPATINGDNLSRVFEVAAGANVTLSDVIITGGNSMADNPAGDASRDGLGGAILVDDGASLTVSGCTLSDNSAYFQGADLFTDFEGGGIYNSGTLMVADSTLSGNSTGGVYTSGGAIYNAGTATLTGSTLSGNSAQLFGGGVYNSYGCTLTMSCCTLSGNSAFSSFFGSFLASAGGGIASFGPMTLRGCILSGNSTTAWGSGIYTGASATVSNCTITGNSGRPGYAPVAYGGGIFNDFGGTITVSACTLSDNSATYEGGGIYNNSTMAVSDCTLSCNSATYEGGGIYDSRTLTVSDTTLLANSATYGGGIFIDSGGFRHGLASATVSGCSLSGNTATFGGGIYNLSGTVTVSGSTLSGNSATQAGGGIYNATSILGPYTYQGILTVSNFCTISGNSAPVGFGADVYNLGVMYLDSSSVIGILDGNPAQPI
jgi:hypothetical protein